MDKKNFAENFLFLSPRLTIKHGHLNRRDINNIKLALLYKMGVASLLVAIGFFLLNAIILISMGVSSNWHIVDTYGLPSLVAQIVSLVSTPIIMIAETAGLLLKGKKISVRLVAFANNSLFLIIGACMFLLIYADAKMGYLSKSPTLSAAIIIVSLLVVMQPVYWSIATVYDGLITTVMIGLAIYFSKAYNMQAVHYYIMIALLFPFLSYLVIALLFYAESQKYISDLKKESMYNTALYDELTHCKNRYALKRFLKENKKRWEDKEVEVLLIMFDIDSFKLYNDQFSHPGGDYCLSSIANEIRKQFPTPNLDFFRYGGEEFLLFFEIEDVSEARGIMEKVRNSVKNLNIQAADGAPKETVTISVGGTIIRNHEPFDFDYQLAVVDKYLYQAKNSGKDVCILDGKAVL